MDDRLKFVAAVLPFLAVTLFSLNFTFFAFDEYSYMNTAYSITSEMEKADLSRFPLLPSLLAPAYVLFGATPLVSRMLIIVLGVMTLAAVFLFARKLLGGDRAWWATLVASSSPLFAFFGTRVLTEMLFMLLLVINISVLYKTKDNPRYFALFGFTSALLFLARYFGLYIFLVLFVYLAALKMGGKSLPAKALLKWIAVCVAVFAATLSPYLLVNYLQTGNPVGLILDFVLPRSGSPGLGFGLPDRIPSFIAALPFVLGLSSPLLWYAVYRKGKDLLSGGLLPVSIAVALITVSMEAFYLFGTPLLRYLVVLIPLLAVIASAAMESKRVEYLGILLIALNLVASFYLVYEFNTGYQKHADFRATALWVSNNCDTYHSNIEYAIFFETKRLGTDLESGPECIVLSSYLSPANGTLPGGYSEVVVGGISDKITLLRKR